MIRVPKNFVDPLEKEQKSAYDNPIFSRIALSQLLQIHGQPVKIKAFLRLYDEQSKKDALLFRLKAMLRQKQLIEINDKLYHPSFFPEHRGIIFEKNKDFFALRFDNTSFRLFNPLDEEIYPGDKCHFYYISDLDLALVKDINEYQNVIIEGHIAESGEYDLPKGAQAVFIPSTGRHIGQATALHPHTQIQGQSHLKVGQYIRAQLDRGNDSPYLFAHLVDLGQQIPEKLSQVVSKYCLSHTWPCAVEEQVEKIPNVVRRTSSHVDLTSLNFVTIDGQSAKDFDDAVYARKVPQGFDLYVAIADVSSYVDEKTPLDLEASKRGVSVYFPRYVIPMLPEKLSNNLCSLRPHRLRKTLTCLIKLRGNRLESYEFMPALIRSKARLTYEEVQNRQVPDSVRDDINTLWSVYDVLKALRQEKGYLRFESRQANFSFDKKGEVNNIQWQPSLESCKLIEEMMLCANVCAAKFLQKNFNNQGVFRCHPEPSQEKVDSLNILLKSHNLSLKNAENIEDINRFSCELKTRLPLLSTITARLMQRAFYQSRPEKHFGLNEGYYTHFTSPIRRYPDLIVHRMIKAALASQPSALIDFSAVDAQLCEVNFLERRAEEAERFYHSILKAYFATALVGKTMHAVINGLTNFGFFIECQDYPLDGLVHFSSLEQGFFTLTDGQVVSDRGIRYVIGQKCLVRLKTVDTENYRLNFELVRCIK